MSLYVRYVPNSLGSGGGGSTLTIGPIDSASPSTDGAVISANKLIMQSASVTDSGLVNLTTQSFAGNKTFTGSISAANLSGTNTGDVTLGTANGLSILGQVLSLGLSSTSTTGALSSTDWNTFNGKQAAGNYITALTGDGTASGPGSAALTLATVNSNVGSFTLTNLTVNGKGLITAASSTTVGNLTDAGTDGIVVTGGTGAVIGSGTSIAQHVADATHNGYLSSTDWSTFNGKQSAGNYITALTGDITASGPGSVAATLATVNSNVGSFTVSNITVNGKGLVTAASSTTTGNLTDAGTDGIVVTGGTGAVIGSGTSIAQHVADSTHNGYLSSTDWSTFNGKQAAGNYITVLTGDATASGPGSAALTFATVNSNVGSFTNANITVNAKGLITAAANGSSGTGTVTSVALSVPATSIFGVTGSPVTTSGTLGLTTTGTSGGIPYFSSTSALSSSALLTANALVLGGGAGTAPVALGSLGTTTTVLHGNAAGAPTFGAVSLTADVSGTLPNTSGGTGQSSAWNANGIIYASSATVLASTAVGNAGQVLTSNGTGVAPTFQANASAITANYAAFYTGTVTSFSTASNTPADLSNSGTPAIVSRTSNGLSITQAGSNLPGFTITPSSATAVYEVTAMFQCRNASNNENFAVRLFDGTNEVCYLGAQNPTSVTVFPITLYGIWAPGTTSASTLKIQGRTSAGTMTIQAIATSGSAVIDWTITQIRA